MDNQYLYRYMSFDELYYMVKENKIALKKPQKWQDPYENVILKAFDNEESYKALRDAYMKNNKDYDDYQINAAIISLYIALQNTYCTCFTSENQYENCAMWRSYSYDNQSLRVKIDTKLLDKSNFSNSKSEFLYELNKINYKEKIDLDTTIQKIVVADNFGFVINQKRKSFKFENEYRLSAFRKNISKVKKDYIKSYASSDLSKLNDFKKIFQDNNDNIIDMEFNKECIAEIVLNPNALVSFEYLMKAYCYENNLTFKGKSTLFTF